MIAKLAFLTTPAPGVFILNIQPEGREGIERFEISKAHLANILIDGCALALREPPEGTNDRENYRRQRTA